MGQEVAARAPIDLLLEYEQQLADVGAALPAQREVKERWSGIGFRVGDHRFLAPMDEVREILDPPDCTRVPGTVSWFLGIANVRGNLVPVFDLHGFLIGGRSARSRQARVLTFQQEGVSAALQVDDVVGMKRFDIAQRESVPTDAEALAPYVNDGFRQGDEAWPVFSLSEFVASKDFLEISR
ncbi:MAG: chemotaxis protein CheW [Halofilum sp. (in: g-proteobacteria)]|nr:chemotaxis protein CheW [Halofilum sp. (in: g-proteobacteria)]